jgi:hypothetical protein
VPFPVEHVRGLLAAGGQLPGAASEARFGDVNLDAPAGLRFCPTASLVDDFADGALAPEWVPYSDPGCTIAEVPSDLLIVLDGIGADDCGILSDHLFDLRDSTFAIDAGGTPGVATVSTYIEVDAADDLTTQLRFELDGTDLDLEQQVAGVDTDVVLVPHDPVDHRWWRIGAAGGRFRLEASPDGSAWTVLLEGDARFDLSTVRLEIGAETVEPGPGLPQMIRIDRAN